MFDFRNSEHYNQFEEVLSHMNLTQRQLNTFNQYFVPRLKSAKEVLRKGVDHLISAHSWFMQSIAECDSLSKIATAAEIFDPSQISKMHKFLSSNELRSQYSIGEIVGLKRSEKKMSFSHHLKDILPRRKLEKLTQKQNTYEYRYTTYEINEAHN